MNDRHDSDRRAAEARKVLDRVERDSEVVGRSTFVRSARKARDHLSGADADPHDWPEVWGRRIGRGLSLVAFVALAIWLVGYLTR